VEGNPLGPGVAATVEEGGAGGQDDSLRNFPFVYIRFIFFPVPDRLLYWDGNQSGHPWLDLS